MDELRARCATVEVDAMELKREKEEWYVRVQHRLSTTVLTDIPHRLSFLSPTSTSTGFTSPRKLTKTLAATQIENASYKEKVDAREAEIKIRDRMIGEFEERCKVLEREADASKRGMEKSEGRAKQVEKRIELRDKEVELLKNSLVSYPLHWCRSPRAYQRQHDNLTGDIQCGRVTECQLRCSQC